MGRNLFTIFCSNKISLETVSLVNYRDNAKLVQNTIILFVKFYIYWQRCVNNTLTIIGVKNFINEQKMLEEQIAKNKNKLAQHLLKW